MLLKKILLLDGVPEGRDVALLAMRVIVGVSILLKHGLEKVLTHQQVYDRLTHNHHYVLFLGVGLCLFWSTISDCVLTLLLILGLATRWCAALSFCTLLTAWGFAIQFAYYVHQPGVPALAVEATHGEMIVAYLASLLGLALMGGGRYSLDAVWKRHS